MTENQKTITLERNGIRIAVTFSKEGISTPYMMSTNAFIRGWMEILMRNVILTGGLNSSLSAIPKIDKLERMFIEKFRNEELT